VPTLLHLLAVVLGVNHFDRGEQFLFLLHISKLWPVGKMLKPRGKYLKTAKILKSDFT